MSVIKINSGVLTAANPKRSGDFERCLTKTKHLYNIKKDILKMIKNSIFKNYLLYILLDDLYYIKNTIKNNILEKW